MSQPDVPHTDAETLTAIKTRYQAEYLLQAKGKLGWWNVFRNRDARFAQVEQIAAKLMQADLASGKLQERYGWAKADADEKMNDFMRRHG